MAGSKHIEFLLGTLGDPNGRKRWLDHKLASPDAELAGLDASNKDLRDYDFSEMELSGANFFGADVTGADFSDAVLVACDFRRAIMNNCVLDRANLAGSALQGAMLSDSCMDGADLSNSRLQGADLIGADLGGANLLNCDLRSACLKYTRLQGAQLQGANVAEADLTGSVMDDDAPFLLRNFDLAIIDDRKYRVLKGATPAPSKDLPGDDTAAGEAAAASARPGAVATAAGGSLAGADVSAEERSVGDDSLFDLKIGVDPVAASFNGSDSSSNLFGADLKPMPPSGAAAFRPAPAAEAPKPAPAKPQSPKADAPKPEPPKPEAPKFESGKYEKPKFAMPGGKGAAASAPPPPDSAEDHDGHHPPGGEAKHDDPRDEERKERFFGFRRAKPKVEERDLEAERKARVSHSNPLGVEYIAREKDLLTDDGCLRILGVGEKATITDITKAFRNKAKIFHPDKVRHMDEKTRTFARDQFEFCRRAHDTLKRRGGGGMAGVVWVEGVPHRHSPYEHTLEELAKLVRVNPNNEVLVYNLAWKYYEAGNLNLAIQFFERVLQINPSNEDARHNLKSAKLQKVFSPK